LGIIRIDKYLKMKNKQTILIAGATGNIGKAAAVALVKRGARVVILGRSHDKLQATKDSIFVKLSKPELNTRKRTWTHWWWTSLTWSL